MCLDTKKRVALQLLHFGLHRMPVAEYGRSRWASVARSVPSNPSSFSFWVAQDTIGIHGHSRWASVARSVPSNPSLISCVGSLVSPSLFDKGAFCSPNCKAFILYFVKSNFTKFIFGNFWATKKSFYTYLCSEFNILSEMMALKVLFIGG